jgi:cell cycle sensor histidine kinase DivJ
VRNFLKSLRNILTIWSGRLNGMVHPQVASDSFLAPLHRSFLISSFLSGGAALIVLPLHLALAGPPHAAVLLVLTWMLGQWPLALYLSRSGSLDRAIGLSAGLFACLVAAICFLTGGPASFALMWLLVPPMEAAFGTGRKTSLTVTALCAVLLAAIALLPLPPMQVPLPASNLSLFTSLAAIVYAGVLSLRLTLDRRLAQRAVVTSEARLREIGSALSEVVCGLDADGTVHVLGGPVADLLGHCPAGEGEDWLFPRLHVADRPLYLTQVSDSRRDGETRVSRLRVRVGASRPGQAGQADYRPMDLTLRPSARNRTSADAWPVLLLTLRDAGEVYSGRSDTSVPAPGEQRDPAPSRTLAEIAVAGARTAAAGRDPAAVQAETPDAAVRTGGSSSAATDTGTCLRQCRDLLMPVAARRGVLVELAAGDDLPAVAVDGKLLRQALYVVLADMIDTCAEGAVVTLGAGVHTGRLDCAMSIRNRQSGLTWSAAGSRSALDVAGRLLKGTPARLSVRDVKGQGDCVIVQLPLETARETVADYVGRAKTA